MTTPVETAHVAAEWGSLAIAVLSALGGAVVAVIGAAVVATKAAWGHRDWLAGQFSTTRQGIYERMDEQDDKLQKVLDDHEDKDQERHEDNLKRFANIWIALARNGIPLRANGDDIQAVDVTGRRGG